MHPHRFRGQLNIVKKMSRKSQNQKTYATNGIKRMGKLTKKMHTRYVLAKRKQLGQRDAHNDRYNPKRYTKIPRQNACHKHKTQSWAA